MAHPGRHFFASARGRLLLLNLLVVAVTLMVSGVAESNEDGISNYF